MLRHNKVQELVKYLKEIKKQFNLQDLLQKSKKDKCYMFLNYFNGLKKNKCNPI